VGRCAPQVALDRPLFYDRAATGAGLTLRPAGDTTFATVAGNSADYGMAYRWRPRVSPDRSKILYVCTSNMDFSGIQRICRANIDGTGIAFAATTWGGEWESSPDWSPDGTKIVLTRNGALYTMNADGTWITLVNASLSSNFMTVAWQPVGGSQVLAFTATDGTVRTASLVDLASPVTYYTGQTVVFSNSAYTWDPSMIEWSPAGDSLAFDLQIDNHRAVVVSGTQASAPIQLRAPVYNYPASSTYFTYPLWTDLGMFFVVNRGGSSGRSRIFLQKADGTIRRVGREPLPGALNNFAPGTWRVAP
jgi:Tol biopolymer transport system component